MWTERTRYQEEPLESYDSLFGNDLQDYLKATSYSYRFHGLSKEQIYEYIKSIPLPPPDRVFRVQNGFNTDRQVVLYFQIYNQMIREGSRLDEITDRYIQMTLQDLEGFNFEFIARNPILINWLVRSEDQILAYKYNNLPLTEVTGTSERDGIYVDVIRELTEKVTKAPPGSTFVITSPKGWAGTNENGETFEFPESQTYIYRIEENGELKAITLRTDLDVEEHERLMQILSANDFLPDSSHSEHEQLKHVSRYVASAGNMTFVDIVNAIQQSSDKAYAWTDNGKQKVTFEALKKQVDNVHDLYSIDSSVQNILDNFKFEMMNFGPITTDDDVQRLIKLLGKTALDISHAHRVKTGQVVYPNFSQSKNENGFALPIDYFAEANYVSVQPGCAMVSSGSAGWQNTALGIRLVQIEDDFGSLDFPCSKGHMNRRPYGKFLKYCKTCGEDVSCGNPNAVAA